jgi:predicted nucleic acid-binding protein
MDAFDADVLIYAAFRVHPLGSRVAALFPPSPLEESAPTVGIGSVLLVPELLTKPLRDEAEEEIAALSWLLARLDLRPVDVSTADLAAVLGAKHGLRAADAVHLATAVQAGADRFITNNRKDFVKAIGEVEVVYPDDLEQAG